MVIEVTDFAKKKLSQLLRKEDKKEYFEFYIAGRNWRGPTFGLVLAELEKGYFVVEAEGYKFAMENGLPDIYKKFVIDYIDDKYRSGFVARGEKW